MTDLELDIWAEIIGEEIDKAITKADETDYEEDSWKHFRALGRSDGLSQALTWFTIVSKGTRYQERISKIKEKLLTGSNNYDENGNYSKKETAPPNESQRLSE